MSERGKPIDPIGSRRPMARSEIEMITRALGPLAAIALDLHLVDYSRGSMLESKDTRCFWLTNGKRVRITMSWGAGMIASVDLLPDPMLPEPLPGGKDE